MTSILLFVVGIFIIGGLNMIFDAVDMWSSRARNIFRGILAGIFGVLLFVFIITFVSYFNSI